jgi:hypothetical protein
MAPASPTTINKIWAAHEGPDKQESRGGVNDLLVHLAITPGETHDKRLCSVLPGALLPKTMVSRAFRNEFALNS